MEGVDAAGVARQVRDFYERHPYPPPVADLGSYRRLWQDRRRRRADHHLHWPARPFREDHTILIAGCGTSQAAKHALRWPAARVTGIDFSATSVARDRGAQAASYDLGNLEVHQLAVEHVRASWGEVRPDRLHRRAPSPRRSGRGARGAARRARADGAMQLMVYAPVRADRRLHAAGVLPAGRHRGHRRRDPGSRRRAGDRCRPRIRWQPCCARPRTFETRRRSPMRCCTRRIAPTRCRSCSISSRGAG